MEWYKVIKPIPPDLDNYYVGSRIPLTHHIWVFITDIPEDCVQKEVGKWNTEWKQ
jgi:hypothetical protein